MAGPEKGRRQRQVGAGEKLSPEITFLWRLPVSGDYFSLESTRRWRLGGARAFSGTRAFLVPGFFWYQNFADTRTFSGHQNNPDIRILLGPKWGTPRT